MGEVKWGIGRSSRELKGASKDQASSEIRTKIRTTEKIATTTYSTTFSFVLLRRRRRRQHRHQPLPQPFCCSSDGAGRRARRQQQQERIEGSSALMGRQRQRRDAYKAQGPVRRAQVA